MYRGGKYPSQYEGAYFWADFALKRMYVSYFDPKNLKVVTKTDTFDAATESIIAFRVGPDGYLYYSEVSVRVGVRV